MTGSGTTGRSAAEAWDAEYAAGRYAGEPPVSFTADILAAARAAGITSGLYVGCGNGRNYLPLVAGGLDLAGLDISAAALRQLATLAPERTRRLLHGDLASIPSGVAYPLVIGIQVFQHGTRWEAPHRATTRPRQGSPTGRTGSSWIRSSPAGTRPACSPTWPR